jgi:hypothetical protein
MSIGFIYFAKNITGYKLGFTKIKLADAIKNLNTSQITENFTLVDAIKVNSPKKIKNEISKKLVFNRINKDLYNITPKDIYSLMINLELKLNLKKNSQLLSERYIKKTFYIDDTRNIYINKDYY